MEYTGAIIVGLPAEAFKILELTSPNTAQHTLPRARATGYLHLGLPCDMQDLDAFSLAAQGSE